MALARAEGSVKPRVYSRVGFGGRRVWIVELISTQQCMEIEYGSWREAMLKACRVVKADA